MPTPTTLLTVSWDLEQLCGASDGPLGGLHHWLRDREDQSPVRRESLHIAPSSLQCLVPGLWPPNFQALAAACCAHC